MVELLDEPEAVGLLALMLLHEARRVARVNAAGELVLLEDQSRSLWDHQWSAEAQGLIERSLVSRRIGPYVLQAAIAGVHAEAPSFAETDWSRIVALYDVLICVDPSPVVALNRAAALAMRDGPEAGLSEIEAVLSRGGLDGYHLAHAARADMQRRLGLTEAARAAITGECRPADTRVPGAQFLCCRIALGKMICPLFDTVVVSFSVCGITRLRIAVGD